MSISKKILIIVLLSLIFFIDIGYAKFSNATSDVVSSNFNVRFENAEVVSKIGVNEREGIKVVQNNRILTLNGIDLKYPGAGIEYSVDIANRGTVPVKIESLNTSNFKSGKQIKLNVTNFKENTILKPGETTNIHVTVIWDEASTEQINESINFDLGINYKQAI